MKYLVAISFLTSSIAFIGCNSGNKSAATDGNVIDSLMEHYTQVDAQLVNDLQKEEYKRKYIDSLNDYLINSMHNVMGLINVKVHLIRVDRTGGKTLFAAIFDDAHKNDYNFAVTYPANDDTSLAKNPLYNYLKNMPENIDTTLRFFYLGNTAINPIGKYFSFDAVPIPDGFNVDSARNILLTKKQQSLAP